MSTLPPLVESSSSERARQLLRAARADGPRPGAAGRALTALGVAGTAATAATVASATAGSQVAGLGSAVSLPMIAAKWLLVGTLGGVALASGATLVFSKHEPARAAQQQLVAAPRANAELPRPSAERVEPGNSPVEAAPEPVVNKAAKPSVASAPNAGGATASAPAPVPFTAPSQAAFASPEQSKLLRDVALLDDARRALKAGDTAQALSLITRYDAERQTHVLDREALLLHIDVLSMRGEHQQAQALAQRYLAAFPNDAHAERLRALVNDGK